VSLPHPTPGHVWWGVVTGFPHPLWVEALKMQFSHPHEGLICINRAFALWMGRGRFGAANDPNVGLCSPDASWGRIGAEKPHGMV